MALTAPTKIPMIWGASAVSPYIIAVPTPSQIGVTNGAASYTDGFPPNCFVSLSAGGAGPWGRDFNGILNQVTAGLQWLQAGGLPVYDSTFQTSTPVGGYPAGALVQSATTLGLFWYSVVANNVTNPDAAGAGWIAFSLRTRLTANMGFSVNFATGSDSTGTGTPAAPWATLQHARDTVQRTYDLMGLYQVSYNCAGNFTAGVVLNGPLVGQQGPADEIFNFASAATITAAGLSMALQYGAMCSIQGTGTAVLFTTSGSPGSHVSVGQNCIFQINSGVNFGTAAGSDLAVQNGQLLIDQGYEISGNSQSHYSIGGGGGYIVNNNSGTITITLVGTPAFSTAFVYTSAPGTIAISSGGANAVSYSGSATGSRYSANQNGTIQTGGGGASYFPGNSAGTTSTGGQYS